MGLKNCPMCDCLDVECWQHEITDVYFVVCGGCGTRTGDYLIESEAIETWNMRVGEDKIWERIEKFRESLELENQYDPALNN